MLGFAVPPVGGMPVHEGDPQAAAEAAWNHDADFAAPAPALALALAPTPAPLAAPALQGPRRLGFSGEAALALLSRLGGHAVGASLALVDSFYGKLPAAAATLRWGACALARTTTLVVGGAAVFHLGFFVATAALGVGPCGVGHFLTLAVPAGVILEEALGALRRSRAQGTARNAYHASVN